LTREIYFDDKHKSGEEEEEAESSGKEILMRKWKARAAQVIERE
jgi:hypothetical protein